MNILLAVDGSPYTQKMLDYLVSHPTLFGPEHRYTVLTVQLPLPSRARIAITDEAAHAYYEDGAQQTLTPVLELLARHGLSASPEHKVGTPGETIADVARSGGFDLLLMGSHGHSALGNLVMGSVATQVLAHCQVPVLLVR